MSLSGEPTTPAPDVSQAADVEQSIHERFAQLAGRHPARTALGSGAWRPTYQELDAAADGLAAVLAHGGAPGDRVALLMRHDTPLIAAVLAALKVGRIVVVLNPTDPPARLEQVLEDAEPGLVLTDPAHRECAAGVAGPARQVLCWENPAAGQRARHQEVAIAPDDVAFLIYTSGSTGRPKGVMLTHRNVLHNVRRLARGLDLRADDRLALPASLSGGHGMASAWCALLNGATLCPFPIKEKGVTGFADWLREHAITAYTSSASVFRQFLKTLAPGERLAGVRLVRLGSEAVSSDDFAAFRSHFPEGSTLVHTFSSSETGNILQVRLAHGDGVADGPLPLGEPAEGIEILLVDERGQEVPVGQTGEMVVRSRYLSPGYWRNEALTAERFAPAAGGTGTRVFRAGDLARRTPDGLLLFEGRMGARVKVHGYGVELSEVEGALLRQPGVAGAVVRARARPDGDAQLIAYVTRRAGQAVSASTLRQALGLSLPGYMVPAGFVLLDNFPLTAHGKIDREALARLEPPAPPPGEEPATETEAVLADIWGEVLGHGPGGRHDDFFELGGDSLLATAAAARASAALGVELDLRVFADHPTPAALAAAIDELRRAGGAERGPPLARVPRDGPLPLSYIQERTWKHSQTPEGSAGYTQVHSHRLRGPLDVAALRAGLNFLVRRHDILRTTFAEVNGRPGQVAHPPAPLDVPLLDFSAAADPEERARQFLRDEARRRFNLGRLPLLRLWLVRVRPDEHWLLRVHHHIISDGWSWRVLFQELALLYEARLRGETPPLPETAPLQYGDFAAWERRALRPEGPAYRKALAWWKDCFSGQPQSLELPFKAPAPRPATDPEEGYLYWGLDPRTSRQLEVVGRETGANYFAVRLAAFVALLAAETGRPDVVLGTYVTNRTRAELRNMFGFFANLATLRFRCDLTSTFRRWVSVVRAVAGEIPAYCAIPYDQLCEELRKGGVTPPEIRAIFNVADQTAPLRLGEVELTWLDRRPATMPWGFTLQLDQHNEEHRCLAMFDARIYDPRGVRDWVGRYARWLDAVSRHPDRRLVELPISGQE